MPQFYSVLVCAALFGGIVAVLASRRPFFTLLCLLGAVGWTVMMLYGLALSGWGDGSTNNAAGRNDYYFFLSPSACLVLFVIASIKWIPLFLSRSIVLLGCAGITFFSIRLFLISHEAWIFLIPLLVISIAACRLLWNQPKNV